MLTNKIAVLYGKNVTIIARVFYVCNDVCEWCVCVIKIMSAVCASGWSYVYVTVSLRGCLVVCQ
jgi:hypothetical protein